MPFRNFFKKEKNTTMSNREQKAKLGMKVVMAQQNPEPVYDLTDCAIVELPQDTFIMCRLLQKTSLLLRNNCISSLEKGGKLQELSSLEMLDLTNNKLSHLPDGISKLQKLKVLKLSNNKLKNLPSSFGDLKNLQELYLSSNRLSKVPTCVCALPSLRALTLNGNSISVLPKEFCELQKSLCSLELDSDKLQSPLPELISEGVETVMRHLCEEYEIEYVGLSDPSEEETAISTSSRRYSEVDTPEDEYTRNYMRRKEEQMKAQLAVEEEFQAKEQRQLAEVLRDMSSNKKHILDELAQTPEEVIEYEKKKLRMLQDQYDVEESVRQEQEEQLLVYLALSDNKDSLMKDLSAQQADLEVEVEGLVNSRDKERKRLLGDLTEMENETAAALQELLSAGAYHKNEEFMCLLSEQEQEMDSLLTGIADASAELRHSEVVAAMQAALMEEAAMEARHQVFQDEQSARIFAVLEENDLVESHLEGVLTTRLADQDVWISTLMEEETVQAEAFKLLLLKMDLKRCNILRQISQVEYELARLSSLEVRKKKYDVRYGSNTMLDQRATLAGLLKSLLMKKSEREAELSEWFGNLSEMRSSDECSDEEFWLVQYQRLLALKPAGLAEAEEQLDHRVRDILREANAADLIPVFARHSVTYESLMNMTEEDALSIGIGPATYHSLQRALQSHLEEAKLGSPEASAPCEGDLPYSPTAPDIESGEEEGAAATAPQLEEEDEAGASAPPFVEAECVVCLNSDCEVIFLPCGHMCVCAKCCTPLAICPLCRSPVISKILKSY